MGDERELQDYARRLRFTMHQLAMRSTDRTEEEFEEDLFTIGVKSRACRNLMKLKLLAFASSGKTCVQLTKPLLALLFGLFLATFMTISVNSSANTSLFC